MLVTFSSRNVNQLRVIAVYTESLRQCIPLYYGEQLMVIRSQLQSQQPQKQPSQKQMKKKQILIGAAATLALVAAAISIKSFLWGPNDARAESVDRTFICAETGQTFQYSLKVGDPVPVPSPYSGRNTGYPPELCYWTKDGGTMTEPTFVLLNKYKGLRGPTFCPVCGRLVVFRNPGPAPGAKPPPTEEEYNARLAGPAVKLHDSER